VINICSKENDAHDHDDKCYDYNDSNNLKKLSQDLTFIMENHFNL